MGIVYNPFTGQWDRDGDRPDFPPGTSDAILDRARVLPESYRPAGDRTALGLAQANIALSTALDRAHLVSFAQIEQMVVGWLNSPFWGLNSFWNATATLVTPSYADALSLTTALRFLQARLRMYSMRLTLIERRIQHVGPATGVSIANMANAFVAMLNGSPFNLRYGFLSTNRAIGDNLDPRLALGRAFDLVTVFEHLVAGLRGQAVFSSETSLALSHFSSPLSIMQPGPPPALALVASIGGVRASTEGTMIGWTHGAPPRQVFGVPQRTPQRNLLRFQLPLLPGEVGTWTNVGLWALVCYLIRYVLLAWLWSDYASRSYGYGPGPRDL